MKFLPANVRGTRDEVRGYGYLVTLADGGEEWHRLAWQATARAHGWIPPKEHIDMSWSFSAVGKPEAVLRALETQNSGLTDQSKAEWDEAKPALAALVGANVGNVAVKVSANGHASFTATAASTPPVKTHGQCSVVIESLYGFVE
jgi:hypothetical protein